MISLCFTTYNRTELLYEAFKSIIDHDFISEIVIVDDKSNNDVFEWILWTVAGHHPKVKLFRNENNMDCYRNKREAVSKAENEWVCILDSDNVFDKAYIDRLEQIYLSGLNPKTVYQPSFAKPHFDFRRYESFLLDKSNIGGYMIEPIFGTMLNAFNYFVNRDEYLKVWKDTIDPVTSDSIYHNLNWFKAGNNMYVVPGLEYTHRIHSGSHYQQNVRRTPQNLHREIENELKAMK